MKGMGQMKDDKSRYTLRVAPELLEKLGYIAEYEGRTKNRELEQMIKRRIADFEAEHGTIQTGKKAGCPESSGAPRKNSGAGTL